MTLLKGLSRPVRLAGVVLIGVALVAVAIGTVSALNAGSTQPAAPASSGGQPATSSNPPPAARSSALPQNATPPTSPRAQPPAGSLALGPTPALDQRDAKWVAVRVYNNSTIKGLAARAADDLRGGGWNITESGNYPYGIIQHSTAYFTPGTDEETAAKALAAAFNLEAQPRFAGIQNSSPGVIVIVTNDYQGKGKD